jgi:hypothetical protein
MIAAPLDVELHCPACGYDLRGSPSGVCPECGGAFESNQLARTSIPWEHRSHYGIARAFFRTIALSLFDLRAFKSEVGREVSLRAAVAFRWIVVALVLAASSAAVGHYRYELERELELQRTAMMTSAAAFGNTASSWKDLPREIFLCAVTGLLAWATPFASILLLLIGWSGLSSYLFQPRRLSEDQQITSLALSYYAAGPLLLLCAAIPFACAGSWILMQGWIENLANRRFIGALVLVVAGAIGAWAILKSMLNSFAMFNWAVRPSRFAGARAAVGLVALWLIVPIISLMVFPAGVGYVLLMCDSLAR